MYLFFSLSLDALSLYFTSTRFMDWDWKLLIAICLLISINISVVGILENMISR